jgi:exodeoxyribonuclease VII large subunit
MQIHTLSSFTTFLRRVLSLNLPRSIWVTAEIGQVNSSRGHYYLSLVEKESEAGGVIAQMDAVLWRGQINKLTKAHGPGILEVLKAGLAVKLKVSAELHDRFGLKLIIDDVDPEHTLGKLQLEKQAILGRLREEKLIDNNGRIPLPIVAQRLAVISSETAAGYADFQEQLRRNSAAYHFKTELFASAMQGALAAEEMIKALRRIERRKSYFDAVVIIRGGGAKLDLLAFDDEQLCRQIAKTSLPVLTGIGHETDEVIADLVAHTSLKTPTAVATYLLEQLAIFETRTLDIGQAIRKAIGQHTEINSRRLDFAQQQLAALAQQQLDRQHQRLDNIATRIPELCQQTLMNEQNRLQYHAALLNALEPQTILSRGYTILSQDGKIIHRAQDIKALQLIEARLANDQIKLRMVDKDSLDE